MPERVKPPFPASSNRTKSLAKPGGYSQTAGMMYLIADTLNCSVIRLTPFASDLFISIDEFSVPSVADPLPRWQAAPPAATSARSQALGLLYPGVAATHQVAETLMVAFYVIMCDEFVNGFAQRAFAEPVDHPG